MVVVARVEEVLAVLDVAHCVQEAAGSGVAGKERISDEALFALVFDS